MGQWHAYVRLKKCRPLDTIEEYAMREAKSEEFARKMRSYQNKPFREIRREITKIFSPILSFVGKAMGAL